MELPKQIYDISVLLGVESINYPMDTPYQREILQTIASGDICDVSRLTMSPHAGAHLDAPSHFIANGRTIDAYQPEEFILPAQVVEIHDPEAVRAAELKLLTVNRGDALLFKTANSRTGINVNGIFSGKFVYIAPDAAEFCVERGISLVGIDYLSVERYGDETFATHKTLLGNDTLVLESINLAAVPPGRYTLLCLPLRISGAEASPVRAILLK
jgi:arylformamidase